MNLPKVDLKKVDFSKADKFLREKRLTERASNSDALFSSDLKRYTEIILQALRAQFKFPAMFMLYALPKTSMQDRLNQFLWEGLLPFCKEEQFILSDKVKDIDRRLDIGRDWIQKKSISEEEREVGRERLQELEQEKEDLEELRGGI